MTILKLWRLPYFLWYIAYKNIGKFYDYMQAMEVALFFVVHSIQKRGKFQGYK